MSTNIHCAWLVPTKDLTALTLLGNELEDLWRKTYADEIATDIAACPWSHKTAKVLFELDPEFAHCKRLAIHALEPVIAMNGTRGVWLMDDIHRETLAFLLQKVMTKEEKMLFSEDAIERLMLTFSDVFEALSKSTPAVVFIPGRNQDTYMVGFGWTRDVWALARSRFQSFSYTNATEMDALSFSKEVQKRVREEQNKDKQYTILQQEQVTRGNEWDEVFETFQSHQYSKCGLTKQFSDPHHSYRVGQIVKSALTLALSNKTSP